MKILGIERFTRWLVGARGRCFSVPQHLWVQKVQTNLTTKHVFIEWQSSIHRTPTTFPKLYGKKSKTATKVTLQAANKPANLQPLTCSHDFFTQGRCQLTPISHSFTQIKMISACSTRWSSFTDGSLGHKECKGTRAIFFIWLQKVNLNLMIVVWVSPHLLV